MNFVVFSYHFLPMNGAEAFCTTRFCSALARKGHSVKVVTMDWPVQVDAKTINVLLDKAVEVVRVPFDSRPKSFLSKIRYRTTVWGSVNFKLCIAATIKVLKSVDRPVLISRSNPEESLVVGACCSKYAYKWIAHFSDPFPWAPNGVGGFRGRIKYLISKLWCAKALRHADGISVTCPEVFRFFKEEYGSLYDDRKIFVTPHIGEPWLKSTVPVEKIGDVKFISHVGYLSEGRYLSVIKKSVESLGPNFILKVTKSGDSPDVCAGVVEGSDVSLVIDLKTHYQYVPFLPSKFVYQLFTDTPIVIYTMKGSAMHRYALQFPSAGIFFADVNIEGSLCDAIISATQNRDKIFDRSGIRREFCEEKIVHDFVCSITTAKT